MNQNEMSDQELRAWSLAIAAQNDKVGFIKTLKGNIHFNERHIKILEAIEAYVVSGAYILTPDDGSPHSFKTRSPVYDNGT